jgi:hypothetical protein
MIDNEDSSLLRLRVYIHVLHGQILTQNRSQWVGSFTLF